MTSSVRAVELACQIAGTASIRTSSPLERCFRYVQTMRHHVFASEARYGTLGQVYLGVEPDFGVVTFDGSRSIADPSESGDTQPVFRSGPAASPRSVNRLAFSEH